LISITVPTKDDITRLAYALYLLRGCEPGRDVEDWVAAEKELCDTPAGQPQTVAPLGGAAPHARPVWFDKSSTRAYD
jgi:hypothetical protein